MCEYCNAKVRNKKIQDIDNDKEDGLYIVFLPEPFANVELNAIDEDGYKASEFFKINYCPMCGRKLGGLNNEWRRSKENIENNERKYR